MADPKTQAEVVDMVSQILVDTGNAIWSDAEIILLIGSTLRDISRRQPYEVKETLSTVANSYDIDVSGVVNLIRVKAAEYLTLQDPPARRSVKRFGDVVTLKLDSRPGDAVDCHLFCQKQHTLVASPTTGISGAANGAGTAGQTAIPMDALGEGTISANSLLSFAGVNGQYRMTVPATISGNASTVTVTPPLLEVLPNDTVATFIYSTLTQNQESILENMVAGRLAQNFAIAKTNKVNVGGERTVQFYFDLGTARLAQAKRDLHTSSAEGPSMFQVNPTG